MDNRFGLNIGDKYNHVNSDGTVVCDMVWRGRKHGREVCNANSGYLTTSECDIWRYHECLWIVTHNQYIFSVGEWLNEDVEKFCIVVDFVNQTVRVESVVGVYASQYYFKDRETAQNVLDYIGDYDWMRFFCKIWDVRMRFDWNWNEMRIMDDKTYEKIHHPIKRRIV